MEILILYIIPLTLAVIGGSLLILSIIYTRWRMRLHKKGILDIRYDGHEHIGITKKNIWEIRKEEKEYDKKNK